MMHIGRVLTLFIISMFVTRGFIPEEFALQLKENPDAMLALELGVASLATLLIASLKTVMVNLPAFIKAMMQATVHRWGRGGVKMEDTPAEKKDESEAQAKDE